MWSVQGLSLVNPPSLPPPSFPKKTELAKTHQQTDRQTLRLTDWIGLRANAMKKLQQAEKNYYFLKLFTKKHWQLNLLKCLPQPCSVLNVKLIIMRQVWRWKYSFCKIFFLILRPQIYSNIHSSKKNYICSTLERRLGLHKVPRPTGWKSNREGEWIWTEFRRTSYF